jgi:hypothetical protein
MNFIQSSDLSEFAGNPGNSTNKAPLDYGLTIVLIPTFLSIAFVPSLVVEFCSLAGAARVLFT